MVVGFLGQPKIEGIGIQGEMYPEWGILERERVTRSVVDKSSFPIPGNGMPLNRITCRHGADPPKNESGSTSAFSSFEKRTRLARARNGFISTNFLNNKFGMPKISIPCMQFCCLSAAMRLVTPRSGGLLS